MSSDTPGDRSVVSHDPGILEAARIDLERLYFSWMGLIFPRQRAAAHSVLGRWRPTTTGGKVRYYLWGAIGMLVLAIAYPLAVVGFATRFYARKVDTSAARIGVLGVILVSLLVWGALTAFAHFRFSYDGFVAVAAAGGVATVSAVLARLFSRGGRFVTVFLAYPFAVTALFLPPVVAALYSPALASVIFERSDSLAIWMLDNVLTVGGLNETIRRTFDLEGLAYVGMWFGIAVPVGWFFGILVSLANVVRPKKPSTDGEETSG